MFVTGLSASSIQSTHPLILGLLPERAPGFQQQECVFSHYQLQHVDTIYGNDLNDPIGRYIHIQNDYYACDNNPAQVL